MNEIKFISKDVRQKSQLYVGRHSYGILRKNVIINGEGKNLYVGRYCSIGNDVKFILGGNHRVDWASTFPFGVYFREELGEVTIKGHPHSNGDIVLGHDVWCGINCLILSGVNIGNGAVIGAGSVVTEDIGPYEIWAGNPARFIKKRFDDDVIDALEALKWWEFDVDTVVEIAPLLSQSPNVELLQSLAEKYADRRE